VLEISPDKVAHIIIKAREYEAKVAAWDDSAAAGDRSDDPEAILEDVGVDQARAEIAAFIAGLNEDEQANLVALLWVGRETYSPEDFDEAVAVARAEHVNATEEYLLGTPLLSEYLAEGLDKMGIEEPAAEIDLLGAEEGEGPERDRSIGSD